MRAEFFSYGDASAVKEDGSGRIVLDNTTGRWDRYAAVRQVKVCWSFDFNWTLLSIHM
jgi:hypothetical protein